MAQLSDVVNVFSCKTIPLNGFSLGGFDERFRGSQRDIPRVVAVQPARVLIATFHPGVGAGNRLNARGAGFAVSLKTLKRAGNIFAARFRETSRENRRVLDRRR